MYLFWGKCEVFTAESDLVLDYFLNNLLVGVLQDDAHFAADIAELFALYVLACNFDFSRKFAVVDVGNDAADYIHERALPFARMPGKERHFTIFCGKVGVFEYLRFSVVGKIHLFKFDRVHKTITNTAPAIRPRT